VARETGDLVVSAVPEHWTDRSALYSLPGSSHLFEFLTRSAHYHFGCFARGGEDLEPALDRLALLDTEALDAGAPILDVGCGLGGTVALLSRRGFRVVGIDPSAPAIRFGRANGLVSHGARLICTDLDQYVRHSPPGRFGAITMTEVSQHFAVLAAALAKCVTLLGAHGKLVWKDVITIREHRRQHVPYHSRASVASAVEAARLRVVSRREITDRIVRTTERLRERLDSARSATIAEFVAHRPQIRQEIDALHANLGHLEGGFRDGALVYESWVLEKTNGT
jgi:cyclopropane fatty-acyl-phospholipid synthase-like methyltransferase